MAKQKGNQQKKWLLPLVKYRYVVLSIIIIILFSGVGAAVYADRVFPNKTNQMERGLTFKGEVCLNRLLVSLK